MSNIVFNFDFKDFSDPKLLEILKFLRITHLGIPNPTVDTDASGIDKFEVFSRLLLREKDGVNTKNLKKQLADYRKQYDLIVVEPLTSGLASIAARDRRVDVIRITSKSTLKVFNTRYGRRLEKNHKMIEVDLSLFWEPDLAKNLRPMLRILRAFTNCNINYILSDRTTKPERIRSYRGIQSIGRILGIPNTRSDGDNLTKLIDKNRKKIEGIIPVEGVEITKW